jgi:hypothetical protein
VDRFWSKTCRDEATGCLNWTGAIKKPCERDRRTGGQSLGHGRFKYEGRNEYAHRVARSLDTGIPVRDLPLVGHECDNPRCVEPTHLVDSSPAQNLREAHERGRRTPKDESAVLADLCAWFDAQALATSRLSA